MAIRTPDPAHGPRSRGTDPRPGEDVTRGGQKSHVGDPSGMQPTEPQPGEPKQRRQPGAPPDLRCAVTSRRTRKISAIPRASGAASHSFKSRNVIE